MPWHTFRLSQAQLAADGGQGVMDQFTHWFTVLGGPVEMAMFFVQLPDEDHATYYLTPETEVLAPALLRLLGAQPGERPPEDATLVVGEARARPRDF
jgi:hypothetical protein